MQISICSHSPLKGTSAWTVCVCKTDVIVDPPSSDIQDLAEIRGKSDFCASRPVIHCIRVRSEDECWRRTLPRWRRSK